MSKLHIIGFPKADGKPRRWGLGGYEDPLDWATLKVKLKHLPTDATVDVHFPTDLKDHLRVSAGDGEQTHVLYDGKLPRAIVPADSTHKKKYSGDKCTVCVILRKAVREEWVRTSIWTPTSDSSEESESQQAVDNHV